MIACLCPGRKEQVLRLEHVAPLQEAQREGSVQCHRLLHVSNMHEKTHARIALQCVSIRLHCQIGYSIPPVTKARLGDAIISHLKLWRGPPGQPLISAARSAEPFSLTEHQMISNSAHLLSNLPMRPQSGHLQLPAPPDHLLPGNPFNLRSRCNLLGRKVYSFDVD